MAPGYPRTLPAVFGRALRKYADRTALVGADRTLTYADLDRESAALSAGLADRGIGSEDRVAVLLDNRPEYLVADLAVMRAGATRLPLNPMESSDGIEGRLRDARARAVVCGPGTTDVVAGMAPDLDALETVVALGDDPPTVADPYEAVLADGRASDPPDVADGDPSDDPATGRSTDPPDGDPDPDDVAGHFYTGGTTGEPKGVLYTHRTLVESLLAHLAELGFRGDDVGLVTTPLSHSGGTFCWATLLAGGRTLLHRGFDAGDVLDAVESAAVTWTFAVPTMLYRLLERDDLADRDLSSLSRLLYGAAPARPDRVREAVERIGPVLVQFYGQTEVPNLITTLGGEEHRRAAEADDRDRLRSAGTPCLRTAVRILDPGTGAELPPGDPGEVVVSAPYAFDGYFERPDETAATLRDGWVHTGDVGVLDRDGYLTLLDRIGDVVVTGGLNVYAGRVETALAAHPDVRAVAVVGVPDEEWGEAVHAAVVPREGADPDVEDLLAFARDRLADHEVPKSVEFVDGLPTTDLGKIARASVRERFWTDEDRAI